jgi:hypothetical protein
MSKNNEFFGIFGWSGDGIFDCVPRCYFGIRIGRIGHGFFGGWYSVNY